VQGQSPCWGLGQSPKVFWFLGFFFYIYVIPSQKAKNILKKMPIRVMILDD